MSSARGRSHDRDRPIKIPHVKIAGLELRLNLKAGQKAPLKGELQGDGTKALGGKVELPGDDTDFSEKESGSSDKDVSYSRVRASTFWSEIASPNEIPVVETEMYKQFGPHRRSRGSKRQVETVEKPQSKSDHRGWPEGTACFSEQILQCARCTHEGNNTKKMKCRVAGARFGHKAYCKNCWIDFCGEGPAKGADDSESGDEKPPKSSKMKGEPTEKPTQFTKMKDTQNDISHLSDSRRGRILAAAQSLQKHGPRATNGPLKDACNSLKDPNRGSMKDEPKDPWATERPCSNSGSRKLGLNIQPADSPSPDRRPIPRRLRSPERRQQRRRSLERQRHDDDGAHETSRTTGRSGTSPPRRTTTASLPEPQTRFTKCVYPGCPRKQPERGTKGWPYCCVACKKLDRAGGDLDKFKMECHLRHGHHCTDDPMTIKQWESILKHEAWAE
jgi:hypothetical protein